MYEHQNWEFCVYSFILIFFYLQNNVKTVNKIVYLNAYNRCKNRIPAIVTKCIYFEYIEYYVSPSI